MCFNIFPISDAPWILKVVYESPQVRIREDSWTKLCNMHESRNIPWSLAHDFNTVLFYYEKFEGVYINTTSASKFSQI